MCVRRENLPSQQNIKSQQRRKENFFTWVMLHPCPKWVNLWKSRKNKQLLVLLLNQVPQCMLFFYLYHCEDQFKVAVLTFLETWGLGLGDATVLVKVKGLPYSEVIAKICKNVHRVCNRLTQMSWISFSFIVHQRVKGARRHGEQVTGVSRVCAVKK